MLAVDVGRPPSSSELWRLPGLCFSSVRTDSAALALGHIPAGFAPEHLMYPGRAPAHPGAPHRGLHRPKWPARHGAHRAASPLLALASRLPVAAVEQTGSFLPSIRGESSRLPRVLSILGPRLNVASAEHSALPILALTNLSVFFKALKVTCFFFLVCCFCRAPWKQSPHPGPVHYSSPWAHAAPGHMRPLSSRNGGTPSDDANIKLARGF